MDEFVEAVDAGVITAPTDSYSPGRAWYALIVFMIQGLAIGIDVSFVTLLVRPIENAFRINDVGFAAITAIPFAIGLTVAFYPAGLLGDTFQRRNIITVGAALWALAALVAARADSGGMLFFARLLVGIGMGISGPVVFSILTDAFPRPRRAFVIGIGSMSGSIGVGLGLTVCSALVQATQHHGVLHLWGMLVAPWQQCFLVVAALGAIVFGLILTISEPPRRDRTTQSNASLGLSLRIFSQYLKRHGILWMLLLIGDSIGGVCSASIGAWAPTFGMRHFGATGVLSIALLGVFSTGGSLLGSVIGGFLGQRSIDEGDARILPRMLVLAASVSLVFAVSFPFMPSWWLAVIAIGAVAAATSMALGVLIPIGIQEAAPNEVRGQLLGLFGFVAFLPSALGATLVAFLATGFFAKAGGLGPALAVVGGATNLLAVLMFAFSGRYYKQARHELHSLVASLQVGGN